MENKEELEVVVDFIMEHIPENLKTNVTKENIITILEVEADYYDLRDMESECACDC